MMAVLAFLFCIGISIRISESSTCRAQCEYDHVTARADCSSRNLNCIPVNYPDSLIMDLSHNNISMLEPDDFSGTFTRLVELNLDNNNIPDVTSLLQSTELESLKKLSVQHNVVSNLPSSCSLSSLEEMSLDYNSLSFVDDFSSCNSLKRFSADSNEIQGVSVHDLFFDIPSFISMRFNRIRDFSWDIYGYISGTNFTILLDNNEITIVRLYDYGFYYLGLLSLGHNRLQYIYAELPSRLIIASNGLREFSGWNIYKRGEALLEELDIRNNSFNALIQPDWAEGLQILYADDNILANLSTSTLQGFINLTELQLANNRLVFISSTALSQLTMLRYLYLDGNALTSLLGGIFLNQADLVELSITNNQLSVLHPDHFLGLNSLERLHLAGNRLVYVHSEMFRQMPGLSTIDFSTNKLEVFHIGNCILGNLANLLLAHNSISNISLILGHCDNLEFLDLSFNQIQVVPGDSITGGNRALSRLELEGNPFYCDCRLKGLRGWLRNNTPSVLPRCQGPPENSGAVVTDLDIHDFICNPPKAMTDVNHLNLIIGQTATLSCEATGIPIPNVMWFDPNGTVIPDEWQGRFIISSDMTLHIISVELSDQGIYTCLAQNILGEMDRALVNLTVTKDQISTMMPKIGPSLAVVVLPTMFITIIILLIVLVLVICLRRRYKNRHHTSSASPGPQNSELAVTFHQGKASNSDGVYVNEVADQECSTAIQRAGTNDEYQDTIRTDEPPQVYQELTAGNNDYVYEPVTVGGNQS